MRPTISSRFIVGFVLAVIGAFMAINIVMEVRLPLIRTVVATLLFAGGARMIESALDRRAPRRP